MLKLVAAAEHLQLYLDHADRPIAGTTYSALYDLIETIDTSHCLDAAVAPPTSAESNHQQLAVTSEPDECQLMIVTCSREVVQINWSCNHFRNY